MANEIIPGLWLGDENAAKDYKFIKNAGINVVVNATKHIPNKFEKSIDYIRIPINDPGPGVNADQEDNVLLLKMLTDLLPLMRLYLQKGRRILVHCHAGRMRSATIVLCFLYKYYYKTGSAKNRLYRSIHKILRNRPVAFNHGSYTSFPFTVVEFIYNEN